MRATLTIDDHVPMSVKDIAHRSGKPFKEVVNEALRKGVNAMEHPEARPYRLSPVSMGSVRPHVNLDKALSLADELEDAAIAIKLEQRK